MDLTDTYRTLHPKAKEYTFFLAPYGTFSKTDHIIGHKTGLNRYKKIEIIPCTLSDHHGQRLVLVPTNTMESTHCTAPNNNVRLQHPTLSNGQIM